MSSMYSSLIIHNFKYLVRGPEKKGIEIINYQRRQGTKTMINNLIKEKILIK